MFPPPLRERPEDIPPLVRHYVQTFANRLGNTIYTIQAETMDTLAQYPWLGNVRELQNVLERASILAADQVLRISSEDLSTPGHAQTPQAGQRPHRRTALDDAEWERIALEEANWIVAGLEGRGPSRNQAIYVAIEDAKAGNPHLAREAAKLETARMRTEGRFL